MLEITPAEWIMLNKGNNSIYKKVANTNYSSLTSTIIKGYITAFGKVNNPETMAVLKYLTNLNEILIAGKSRENMAGTVLTPINIAAGANADCGTDGYENWLTLLIPPTATFTVGGVTVPAHATAYRVIPWGPFLSKVNITAGVADIAVLCSRTLWQNTDLS